MALRSHIPGCCVACRSHISLHTRLLHGLTLEHTRLLHGLARTHEILALHPDYAVFAWSTARQACVVRGVCWEALPE
eukprot:13357809-Alexandrium_andersonii.AAC.1